VAGVAFQVQIVPEEVRAASTGRSRHEVNATRANRSTAPRRRWRPRRWPPRRRAWLIAGAALAVGMAWTALWQPHVAVRISAAMNPAILHHVETERKLVALTIDDGPSAFTPKILDLLAEHDARATFFLIGSRARERPDLVARIRDDGHQIGNHMMRDRPTVLFGTQRFEEELARTARILELEGPGHVFRPPSSWIRGPQLAVLARRGYQCVLGSVYPHDTKHRNARFSSWFVLRRVRPGAIVILHEGGPSRRAILPVLRRVLPELKKRGYRMVTVDSLMAAGPT
jgi:peptidoglycan/xylan/chitin deacetylase (PgdA/CDA1 family)